MGGGYRYIPGTNYSHACFGAIGPGAAKEAHHERSKLMMRVYALEHDEAYVAANFAATYASSCSRAYTRIISLLRS